MHDITYYTKSSKGEGLSRPKFIKRLENYQLLLNLQQCLFVFAVTMEFLTEEGF